MAFFVAGAAVFFIGWGLLGRIRLIHNFTLEYEQITIEVQVQCFYGLLRLRLEGRVRFFPIQVYLNGKRRKKKKKGSGKKNELMRELLLRRNLWFKSERVYVRGTVGSASDACRAIYAAGAVSVLSDCLIRALFQPDVLAVQVMPVCGARCFCLNLEGIATLRPWQIIGVAIKHQIRGTRGKKLWRIRSKTS